LLSKAVKYLLATLFIGILLALFSPTEAHAEEVTVQVTPASDSVLAQIDTATATIAIAQTQVDGATATVATAVETLATTTAPLTPAVSS
jgi:hypothetical protein